MIEMLTNFSRFYVPTPSMTKVFKLIIFRATIRKTNDWLYVSHLKDWISDIFIDSFWSAQPLVFRDIAHYRKDKKSLCAQMKKLFEYIIYTY